MAVDLLSPFELDPAAYVLVCPETLSCNWGYGESGFCIITSARERTRKLEIGKLKNIRQLIVQNKPKTSWFYRRHNMGYYGITITFEKVS